MPKTSELSEFLVPQMDVKDGDLITFVDGGKLHTYEDGRTTIQMKVRTPADKVKILSLNRTSVKNLAPLYGDETEGWEGKEAMVSLVKMNVRGEIKDVIYLFPVKQG